MKKQKISLMLHKQKISSFSKEVTNGGRNNNTLNPYPCGITALTDCGQGTCPTIQLTNQTVCCEYSKMVC
jgi:hypothetical protein